MTALISERPSISEGLMLTIFQVSEESYPNHWWKKALTVSSEGRFAVVLAACEAEGACWALARLSKRTEMKRYFNKDCMRSFRIIGAIEFNQNPVAKAEII